MLVLRRHMRGCLACRAALREARHVPARVAALAPAGALALPHATSGGHAHPVWSWLHERVTSLAIRGQEFSEALAAHKAAAVAASAVAVAGGGVATVDTVTHHSHPTPVRHAALSKPVVPPAKPAVPTKPPRSRPAPRAVRRKRSSPPAHEPTPVAPSPQPAAPHDAAPPAPTSKPAASGGGGADEFGP
jgi:hypothetical protein